MKRSCASGSPPRRSVACGSCRWRTKRWRCTSACSTPRRPIWVKATAAAALAYFILPFDAVPDFLPIVGLSDDASVLAAALTAIAAHITDEHRTKARVWMEDEIEVQARVQG